MKLSYVQPEQSWETGDRLWIYRLGKVASHSGQLSLLPSVDGKLVPAKEWGSGSAVRLGR